MEGEGYLRQREKYGKPSAEINTFVDARKSTRKRMARDEVRKVDVDPDLRG